MLDQTFGQVYTKFKLHFYKQIFNRFEDREATLTTVESFCMEVIMALGEPTIAQFSHMMNLSTPNAAYKINSLVKKGYVERIQSTTALISALSEIPVRHDLAMTGEITLHGNVLPIGGLKEKSMAAFREGISTVLIPEANKPDLYEVDEEVKKAVKFIPVSDLSQVLKHALILPAASAAHKRTMPQATQLIATEQSTAKEPAAVM